MKYIKILCIVFFSIQLVSCKTDKKSILIEQRDTVVNLKTATLTIEGMTCEVGCARTIESKISKMEGVSESKVSFEVKKGFFTYDANKTSEAIIIKEINGLLDGKTYLAVVSPDSGDKAMSCCGKGKKECKHNKGSEEAKSCKEKGEVNKTSCGSDCKKACCVTKK